MKTWIIVADASRARIFDVSDGELVLVQQHVNPNGRVREQELVTDRPGRMEKGRGRHVRSAFDSGTTPHEVETVRFARRLGRLLDEAREEGSFRWLAVVAAPRFLGLLVRRLSPRVLDAVIATIDKDYVKLPDSELQVALTEALTESAAHQRLAKR